MDLGQTRRGIFIEMKYLTPERSTLIYEVCILYSLPSVEQNPGLGFRNSVDFESTTTQPT